MCNQECGNRDCNGACKNLISDIIHSTASRREARLKQHGALHTADDILALDSMSIFLQRTCMAV